MSLRKVALFDGWRVRLQATEFILEQQRDGDWHEDTVSEVASTIVDRADKLGVAGGEESLRDLRDKLYRGQQAENDMVYLGGSFGEGLIAAATYEYG